MSPRLCDRSLWTINQKSQS